MLQTSAWCERSVKICSKRSASQYLLCVCVPWVGGWSKSGKMGRVRLRVASDSHTLDGLILGSREEVVCARDERDAHDTLRVPVERFMAVAIVQAPYHDRLIRRAGYEKGPIGRGGNRQHGKFVAVQSEEELAMDI